MRRVLRSSNLLPGSLPTRQEQVVVTGSYGAVPLEETDRSVDVIDVGQSTSEYRSVLDAMEQDSSLDVQQRVPGTEADLSIRGTTFEETLILVNGLRLNDVQTGHNNLDVPFPFESVQRIEVLKGAGSTLYGSDAMGGAVNLLPLCRRRAKFDLARESATLGRISRTER